MSILASKYNDVSFYSGFSYLRKVHKGVINSYWDGYSHTVNGTVIPLPAGLQATPPYIEWYMEYLGKWRTPDSTSGIMMGADSANLRADGYNNDDPTFGENSFRLHYIIYDRAV